MGCQSSTATAAPATKPVSVAAVRENAKPIIIYSERTLPAGEGAVGEFTEQYTPAAEMIWDVVPGCKMIITTPHATKPNVWHDIQWFNSRDAFNQHIDMSNTELMTKVKSWVGKYDMSHPFTGDVFGDWHEMAV